MMVGALLLTSFFSRTDDIAVVTFPATMMVGALVLPPAYAA